MKNESGSRTNRRSEQVGEQVGIYLRGRIWHANYQLQGKQFRVSLNTTHKKTAIRRALEIDRKLSAGDSPARVEPTALHEAVVAYTDYLEAEGRAKKTMQKYRKVLERVESLAHEMGRHLLNQLDLTFLDKYRAMRAKDCQQKTIYNEIVIVSQLVRFALSRKMLLQNPLSGLKQRKPKPTPQPTYDDDQIEKILATAKAPHWATFLLLAETGFRFGEAQWLTWDDVDLKKNVLLIRPKDDWKPKTGDIRAVPISPRLRAFLERHPRLGRWVLVATPTPKHPSVGRQVSGRRALAALKRVLKPLNIQGKLHSFRHSFITRVLTRGIEEAVVRSWVGHVDPQIMRLYTHISSQVSQDRIKRLSQGQSVEKPSDELQPPEKGT